MRYMTIADRRDFIEAALELIALRKRTGFALGLAARYKKVVILKGVCINWQGWMTCMTAN